MRQETGARACHESAAEGAGTVFGHGRFQARLVEQGLFSGEIGGGWTFSGQVTGAMGAFMPGKWGW